MFEKKVVVYLTRSKIWSGDFASAKPQLTVAIWNGIDPTQVFREVRETYKTSSVRLVLGDDLSFVLYLEISGTSVNRDKVLETAVSLLPIELSHANFDWRLVNQDEKKNLQKVQVWAISREVLNAISFAAKVNKLKIDTLEPISLVLAHAVGDAAKPQLALWSGQESLAVVTNKGVVYHVERLAKNQKDKIAALITFAKEKFGLTVAMSELDVEPLALVARKSIVHGQDQDVLEIKLLENTVPPTEQKKDKPPLPDTGTSHMQPAVRVKRPVPLTFTKVAAFLVIVAAGLTVFWFYRNRSVNKSVTDVPDMMATPTPDTFASPLPASGEEVNISDYKGQILNGSGAAGEASRVVAILQAEGFTAFDTGNADSYDYTETQVRLKETVPDTVYEIIDRSLNSDYRVVKSELLTPDAKYDLIITVGERRTQ